MGRPITKQLLNSISVQANLGSGTVSAWLIAQKGTSTYIATDGTNSLKVKLQAGTPSAAGQAQCSVVTPSGTEYLRTITSNVIKTFSGNTYRWVEEGATGGDASLSETYKYLILNNQFLTLNGKYLILKS